MVERLTKGQNVLLEADGCSLEGEVVQDCDDLEGIIVIRCACTGEILNVNGWMFSVEVIDDAGGAALITEAILAVTE